MDTKSLQKVSLSQRSVISCYIKFTGFVFTMCNASWTWFECMDNYFPNGDLKKRQKQIPLRIHHMIFLFGKKGC